MQSSSRIIGIDPGYDRCGFAVTEKNSLGKEKLIYSECFSTSKPLPFLERLRRVGSRFEELIQEHAPDIVGMEKLYFENNQKSAMAVSEVRGALLYIAASHSLPVHEYTPLEVKAAVTGYGKSDKKQVAFMVGKLLALATPPKLDDEYDAIAIALTASASVRR